MSYLRRDMLFPMVLIMLLMYATAPLRLVIKGTAPLTSDILVIMVAPLTNYGNLYKWTRDHFFIPLLFAQ